MKTFLYIAWVLFGVGLIFKLTHIPGNSAVMVLATVFLSIHSIIFAFTEGKKDHSKSFLHLSFTLWTIYLLFRIHYWPVNPFIAGFSVWFIMPFITTTIFFVLHLRRNAFYTFSLIALSAYLLFSTILSYIPAYKIYYFIYLNEVSNGKSRNLNYLAWDKYSWFLYVSNQYNEALEANSRGQRALSEYLKIANDIEAIQYMPQIENHKQLIQNRSWTVFP